MYMKVIKVLTDDDVKNFNSEAAKHEVIMAGFFMEGCPHCVNFKPEWEKFVKQCESEDEPDVLIAEVDSNQAKKIDFDTSNLNGFPAVLLNKKGEIKTFEDKRDSESLKKFLKMAMETSTKPASSNVEKRLENLEKRVGCPAAAAAGGGKRKRRRKTKRRKTRKGKRKTVKRKGNRRKRKRRSRVKRRGGSKRKRKTKRTN